MCASFPRHPLRRARVAPPPASSTVTAREVCRAQSARSPRSLSVSASQGGDSAANNYPHRGAKFSNWQGGIHGTAFATPFAIIPVPRVRTTPSCCRAGLCPSPHSHVAARTRACAARAWNPFSTACPSSALVHECNVLIPGDQRAAERAATPSSAQCRRSCQEGRCHPRGAAPSSPR